MSVAGQDQKLKAALLHLALADLMEQVGPGWTYEVKDRIEPVFSGVRMVTEVRPGAIESIDAGGRVFLVKLPRSGEDHFRVEGMALKIYPVFPHWDDEGPELEITFSPPREAT